MKKWLPILCLICFLTACAKKTDNVTVTIPIPGKSSLLFPAQNAACTSGTVLTSTQTLIAFNWTGDANTESYEVNIKNLLTATVIQQTVTSPQVQVTLLSNTPYSWFVISKSSKTIITTQSDTWKFYIAGAGSVSHPPYPADALKPTFAQSITSTAGNTNLNWTGTDPDNDIISYDIYLGTTTNPALFKNTTDMFLNNIAVTSGNTYFWKVITKDSQGNTSDSGIYQFKVN